MSATNINRHHAQAASAAMLARLLAELVASMARFREGMAVSGHFHQRRAGRAVLTRRTQMRQRLQVVPQAARTARGAEGGMGLSRTGSNLSMLHTGACFCGAGRRASSRYVCITCARFARYAHEIEERAPHRYTEQRCRS